MIPSKHVRRQLGELLAADTTTLAAADANVVVLVKEPFTPSENLEVTDFVAADFDGSEGKLAGTGTQLCGLDPATGRQIITLKEPAGGWRWECTGDTNLPQTIYGYYVVMDDGTTVIGSQALEEPVAITEEGQEINLGTVKMTVVEAPLS